MILGEPSVDGALGSVMLLPHQLSAVERLEIAIDRFNGALLSDDVGMGKTYVALAIARRFDSCLIVAPAALNSMWRGALAATGVAADLISFETLSRIEAGRRDGQMRRRDRYELVVVDEAHHARNPRTNRYFALESLVRGASVLLLSATPIHNRRDDLVALLSLFLGSRARALTSAELALCVVRREQKQLHHSAHVPAVLPIVYHELSDDRALAARLLALPPPIPLRDGGVAGALVGRGILHQWASSEAAFNEALKRRIARAAALCASLEAGTYPTARELETWIYGEGALQLGFAELLATPIIEHGQLLPTVRAHLDALQQLRAEFGSASGIDVQRAELVAAIRSRHPGTRVVAFAQYAETVSMLFRRLVRAGRVAMLTSHGARVAGGSLTRMEAINRFAPKATGLLDPSPAQAIDLLLTTDLLSEGVNLQDAGVVIHLDVPWTAARMEQRVGRVARLGSSHEEVSVHVLRPPSSAEEVLRTESLVQRKWRVAKTEVGTGMAAPLKDDAGRNSTSEKTERLRTILESWITRLSADESPPDLTHTTTLVATLESSENGFIAAASAGDVPQLVVTSGGPATTDLATQIDICEKACNFESETDPAGVDQSIDSIHQWFYGDKASTAAGLGSSTAQHRREITRRIDACIESAPPHLRTSRLVIAARARRIATAPQCAAVERELESLVRSDLPADEWLQQVAALETTAGRLTKSSTGPLRIHALLILRQQL